MSNEGIFDNRLTYIEYNELKRNIFITGKVSFATHDKDTIFIDFSSAPVFLSTSSPKVFRIVVSNFEIRSLT